ncbi:ABC transporter substrate-binding protein [Variovorax sp. dw_954]|uniref:ABC transporter substrate-binding protein n=1 Tax=Variovorax sp. dw_954 TaxID=2720078 RepID=UPI00211668ED|nr:ABC transporter substrate-binding protein [Variovorax sp. dw_954]
MTHRLLCTAAAAFALLAGSQAGAQTPMKIGFLATLSGPLGTLGQDQYDGFMLAVEQRGGKLGGVPVQVLKEDDQFKPEVALQLAQKMIERENVPIITGMTASNVMMAVAKPITDKKVFLLSTNAGPSALAGAGCSPYQYVVSFQIDTLTEGVGKYASDKGYKKVTLLTPNYVAGKDMLAGFKRYYRGTVVDEVYTPLNQLDFSSEITQIASNKPDAVFVFYAGALGVNFVRQYQQAGLLKTLPLLSTGTIDGTSLPALKDSALGALSGHMWAPDIDNPANREFVDAYEKKYNRIPSNFAAQAYDGALLLDSAIAKVKGNVTDKTAFTAAMKAADFKSVRGSFRFGNNNFPIQDLRMFEVAKDAKGRVSLKTVATSLKDYQDPFHAQCSLP